MSLSEWVPVTDTASVGEVRRTALGMAQRLGFDETRAGELSLLATEVTRNVLVHGGGGQVIVGGFKDGGPPRAHLLAIDSGPGIGDVARAMEDGFSTAGTMGAGLGAMKRIASQLEIFTARTGTIVYLGLGEAGTEPGLPVAGLSAPYPGERVCGDAWACHQTPDRTLAMIVDGLGHGWGASEAAQEAITTFYRYRDLSPGQILGYIHDALRKTRGAVAAIAEIQPQAGSLVYAGVGNIAGVIIDGNASRSLVSHNGTLGMATARIQEFRSAWPAKGVLVLHSDGLQSRWDLSGYAGVLARHPAVIAGVLLRDFRRQRDDASVLVIKAA